MNQLKFLITMAELIKSKQSKGTFLLHLNGFLYYKNGGKIGEKVNWKCRSECGARLITVDDDLTIMKGKVKDHTHPPNPEEVEAERIIFNIKRKAAEHPEAPPSRIVRTALRGISDR